MQIREKILVIEDEKSIAQFIAAVLSENGYETVQARSGAEALSMISSHCPDLIILDLGLPDMDGLEILRQLRGWSSLPVVVVSARSHERDKVTALDAGADDYLTKPFGTNELLARVRTAIRHTRTASGNDEIAQKGTYTVGDLVIDYNKHQALVRGENVKLTLSEFRIVALLGKYAGKVLTYDFIIKELWGPRAGGAIRFYGSIWPISAGKLKKILRNRSICSRKSASATVSQRANRIYSSLGCGFSAFRSSICRQRQARPSDRPPTSSIRPRRTASSP